MFVRPAEAAEPVIAIDVLLLPDQTMIERAKAANARLRENYAQCYTLGPAQVAHITLVQRYVRTKDLKAIEEAVANVLAKEDPRAFELTAIGYAFAPWAGVAITSIAIARTPELDRLHQNIVKAVEPFAVAKASAAAFSTSKELPKVEADIIEYVAAFVPKSSGKNYHPHVTIGVARESFVERMKAGQFDKLEFKPAGVAIYQLGAFGTAQRKLWE
jgi:2'-5' RNA ligase